MFFSSSALASASVLLYEIGAEVTWRGARESWTLLAIVSAFGETVGGGLLSVGVRLPFVLTAKMGNFLSKTESSGEMTGAEFSAWGAALDCDKIERMLEGKPELGAGEDLSVDNVLWFMACVKEAFAVPAVVFAKLAAAWAFW